jgi:thiol:disulfide interchange protein DsbD
VSAPFDVLQALAAVTGTAAPAAAAATAAAATAATTTASAAAGAATAAAEAAAHAPGGLLSGGLLWALLVAFGGGLAAAVTPCVYPLIPITVSLFGAKKGVPVSRGAALSGLYIVGIALTYTTLGVVAASTGRMFGATMASPFVIGFVALVFGAFSLSLLGVYEIQLPERVRNRLNQVGGAGPFGALAMGLVAGLVAAPCTGPILFSILTYIASTGNQLLGALLMLVFAVGMGLPFFVVGTALVALPKPGGWMEKVESAMGIALLGTAVYFLKDQVPLLRDLLRPSFWRIGAAVALGAAGVALGAVGISYKSVPWQKKVLKLSAAALVAVALYVTFGSVRVAAAGGPTWTYDEAAALAEATGSAKPVLIDFWASWCGACNELDEKTYPDPRVITESWRFVMVKIDATDQDDSDLALSAKYGVRGLPTVVFVDSKGNVLPAPRFTGWVDADAMLAAMRSVK